MIRAGLSIAAFAGMLLAADEVRAINCSISLQGNFNDILIERSGPCPQMEFGESSFAYPGWSPRYVNGSVAADLGSAAARAFWSGHAYTYYNNMVVHSGHDQLQCTLSGPSSPVLTRLAFEAEAAVSLTRNGVDYGINENGELTGGTAGAVVYLSHQGGTFILPSWIVITGFDDTEEHDDYECSVSGAFSITECSGSISFARQKYFTPQISVPTGTIGIYVRSEASGKDYGINEPVGIPNSASARAEVSLPSDGSPVLDLPEGYNLNCENGTVVDNVWQGVPVSLPGPPPIVPALSRSGVFALAAALLTCALAAIRIKRRA